MIWKPRIDVIQEMYNNPTKCYLLDSKKKNMYRLYHGNDFVGCIFKKPNKIYINNKYRLSLEPTDPSDKFIECVFQGTQLTYKNLTPKDFINIE